MPKKAIPTPAWSQVPKEQQIVLTRIHADNGGRAAVKYANAIGIECTAAQIGALAKELREGQVNAFEGIEPQASSDALIVAAIRAQARCCFRLETIAKSTGSYRAESELSKACRNLSEQLKDVSFKANPL